MKKMVFLRITTAISFFVLVLTLILSVPSCKKQIDSQAPEQSTSSASFDTLSAQDNAFLENQSVPTPALHDMIGSDGNLLGRLQGVQSLSDNLIALLLQNVHALADQKSVLHPAEGANKPAHNGFAYSFGQRDMQHRLFPPAGNNLHRQFAVFGTDCSGLYINIFNSYGIAISGSTTSVANFENALRNALQANTAYSSLTVRNLGYVPSTQVKSGDLVLWLFGSNNGHMGMICRSATGIVLFNSNGTGSPVSIDDQQKNLGSTRGVHAISFTSATNVASGYWGTGYIILRIVPVTASLPVLTTAAINSINISTLVSGGTITSDGGDAVTARGACWSTVPNPTFTNNHTNDGTGTGTFSSTLTGLANNTTYHVRSYAINSIGVAYGNELSFTTSAGSSSFAIGQTFGGGIIFYLDATGQHGWIAANNDQSSSTRWYNGSIVSNDAFSTTDGAYNTTQIIAQQGNGSYAASLCRNYTGGGFADWYLPAKVQLNTLYLQRNVIGNFSNQDYWSSTQFQTGAYEQDFSNGDQGIFGQDATARVRAIRSF
jgi:hypothetical protein